MKELFIRQNTIFICVFKETKISITKWLNDPSFVSYSRYAKIWKRKWVLKQEKIESFIDDVTPEMTLLFYSLLFMPKEINIWRCQKSISGLLKKEWMATWSVRSWLPFTLWRYWQFLSMIVHFLKHYLEISLKNCII